MNRVFRTLLTGIPVLVLSTAMVFAQGTGQISGRVTDATGAVLPGVDVALTQTGTGVVRSAVSNETGSFNFAALNPAQYQLEVSLPGFQTFIQTDIGLQVNDALVIDAVLQVGQVAQTIEVTANSEIQVETRTLGISDVIENQRIVELPLNGRQVTDLITLAGGAVEVGDSPPWSMETGVNISVAGGTRFGVAYSLDGATHSNPYDATSYPVPFPDALQEFSVNRSSQGAQTGRATGAAVNAVTQTGTNELHGNVFWFVRNAVFNARQGTARTKDQLKRNQYGFTVGGPLVENKLFAFGGFEGTKIRTSGSTRTSVVPTAAMLAGDWTAYNACFNPRYNGSPEGRDFADGTIDPTLFSNAAKLISARLPAAEDACGNVTWGVPTANDNKQFISRLDYQANQDHSFFGRAIFSLQDAPPLYTDGSSNVLTTANITGVDDVHTGITFGETWLISPTMINSARFAFNRIGMTHAGARFFNPEEVGVLNTWSSVPNHWSLNAGSFRFGSGVRGLALMVNNQYQISDDVTMTKGNHQIGFGGSWNRTYVTAEHHVRSVSPLTIGSNVTGNNLSDFMLGRVGRLLQSMPNPLAEYQDYIGLYISDTWRATDNLTFNLGVRWEPYLPQFGYEDVSGAVRQYTFSREGFMSGVQSTVFPGAPGGFLYPGDNGYANGTAGTDNNFNQWLPRVGLSWDPTGEGRTSIRSGFGLAYDVLNMQLRHQAAVSSPWSGEVQRTNLSLDNVWEGVAGGNPFPFDWQQNALFLPNGTYMSNEPSTGTPYTISWNLGVQQQIGDTLLSVTYLGSQGVHLPNVSPRNPIQVLTAGTHPGLFPDASVDSCVLEGRTFTPCNQRGSRSQRRELRLWAQANGTAAQKTESLLLGYIDAYASEGTSTYHGLLTSIRGQVAGINLNANHTWSQCISDYTQSFVPGVRANYKVGHDRGHCIADRRHIFNLTAVASTPEFANRGANAILGDWTFSTILRMSSGRYLDIDTGADYSGQDQRDQRPNQIMDNIRLDGSGELNTRLFNPAAFAPVCPTSASCGQFGDVGYRSALGIGSWDLDVALSRAFNITENQSFEVRAEAFNLTNSMKAINPSGNWSSGQFGFIRRVEDPRIMQFALKYTF